MVFYTAEQAMHLKRQMIGFRINNRPAKSFIFLHFINPVQIEIGGKVRTTSSNACIIFTPGSLLNYSAEKIMMLHNFLHFNVADEKKFRELGLPFNTLFYTNLQNEITDCVELIETCTVKKFNKYPEQIDRHITRIFSMLAEEQRRRVSIGGISTQSRFEDLRSLIFQSPKNWSVASMAEYVNLSRSRFSTKYRELFAVTPNQDLTDAALLYANKLLATSDIRVCDLAYECGFTSPDYFIRLYKRNFGITPGAYRKKLKDRAGQEDDLL